VIQVLLVLAVVIAMRHIEGDSISALGERGNAIPR